LSVLNIPDLVDIIRCHERIRRTKYGSCRHQKT
jgi:hypothetical protein